MCTGLARLPGGAEATVQFKSGEGLQKDSTVDAYIQGDQAYVGSFPNEVYSTIIPLLLGGAAVPVRSFGSRQSCVLPRCARPLSCWVTQFAPQHIPCRRTKLSRSIPVRASSTCRREHVFRAVTHLSDVSHFGGTGKSIS
jgi:hypothetical protein